MLALVPALALVGLPVATAAAAPEGTVTRAGGAPSGEQLQLVLPLVAHTAALRQFALALTTLGSHQYAHYESIPQVARRFGASAQTRGRVVRYLRAAGATRVDVDATGLFADTTVSVSLAQRLFATSLAEFRTARGARFIAPSDGVRVPKALRGLVTGVVGLNTEELASAPSLLNTPPFLRPSTEDSAQESSGYEPASGTPTGCGASRSTGGFTPNQYLTAYGYDPLHRSGDDGQGERVALVEVVGFRHTDVATFAHCFGLRPPSINWFGVGVSKQLAPAGEATFDLEVLDAARPPD